MVVDGSWWFLCPSGFPSRLARTAFIWTPLLMKVYLLATSFLYSPLHSCVCNDKVVVKTVASGPLSPPLIFSSGLSFTFSCSAITTRPSPVGSFPPFVPASSSLDLLASPLWCSRQTQALLSAENHEEREDQVRARFQLQLRPLRSRSGVSLESLQIDFSFVNVLWFVYQAIVQGHMYLPLDGQRFYFFLIKVFCESCLSIFCSCVGEISCFHDSMLVRDPAQWVKLSLNLALKSFQTPSVVTRNTLVQYNQPLTDDSLDSSCVFLRKASCQHSSPTCY